MPWIHSPSVRQGRGSHLRTSITPGSFPSVCSHMISFPHCRWLTPRFMQMCRLAMGFERPILPSARKGFPTLASDTPHFGILAVVILLLVPPHTHTPLTRSPKAIEPKQKAEIPLPSKDRTQQRETALCLVKATRMPPISFYRDIARTAGRGWSLGGVSPPARWGGQHETPCSLFWALLPSSSPLWDLSLLVPRKGSDEISRNWKDFLKQANSGKGKAHSLPCLICLSVLKSWPAAGAGTERAPSSGFAICGWGQEQRGKRLQAGCMLDASLLRNLVLTKGARL